MQQRHHGAFAVKPGRWLADDEDFAAIELRLSGEHPPLSVSITRLDTGDSPMCTLSLTCTQERRTLELIAAFRIYYDSEDEPDLAMYLTTVIRTSGFRRKVLGPFVAEMRAGGMY